MPKDVNETTTSAAESATEDDTDPGEGYERKRRSTLTEYVRNQLWSLEWTPWFNFKLEKHTFFDYYNMESRQAPTTDEELPEQQPKEENYGALLDYVFNLFSSVSACRQADIEN